MSNDYQPTARLLSVRDAGWLEVGDSRVFLCDAQGGFYALREQIAREVGDEFAREIFARAGFASAARLMEYCIPHGFVDASDEGLQRALSLLMTGGYGQFTVAESRLESGWAVVTVRNSVEGATVRQNGGRSGFACDYARGLLQGIMHHLLAAGGDTANIQVECAEISCVANGDAECRLAVGRASDLAARGYRVGLTGQTSVRETLLRLNRQLEEVLEAAQRDPVTRLYNRGHFESVLRHRIEHASRRTDTLAMVMIDVDRFKEVNDTQGHAAGDAALRHIASLLSAQARETDLVARYGGDEFAWLMPNTSVEAALAVADRIRRLVEQSQEVTDIPVTLSLGIASCPEDATTMAELIHLADHAMYRAKDEGGNRVKRYVNPAGAAPSPSPVFPSDAAPAPGEAPHSPFHRPAQSISRRPQVVPAKRRRARG